jgi:hypothetical protein
MFKNFTKKIMICEICFIFAYGNKAQLYSANTSKIGNKTQ